jgi:hypothetical protein
MHSFKSKSLGGRLMLISAVVLLGANGAFAAESAVDAQRQARDLLAGTPGGLVKPANVSPAVSAEGQYAFDVDAQEQARQLLSGKRNGAGMTRRTIGIEAK